MDWLGDLAIRAVPFLCVLALAAARVNRRPGVQSRICAGGHTRNQTQLLWVWFPLLPGRTDHSPGHRQHAY